jgi:hypothetical protein
LLGSTWSFAQIATLLWDHFAIPNRDSLDAAYETAGATFVEP